MQLYHYSVPVKKVYVAGHLKELELC